MDRVTSPDGTIAVDLVAFEMRMSHWVCNPVVRDVVSGDVLLDLTGTMWDAGVSFTPEGAVVLDLREYPGSAPGFRAIIDPRTLEVRTGAFGAAEEPASGGMTLESLWRSLAPGSRVSAGVRRRRGDLDREREAAEIAERAAARRAAEEAERARAELVERQCAQAAREAEADRAAAAERMRRQREEDHRRMRALVDRTLATEGAPAPAAAAPSLREAAGRFGQALAALACVVGTLGLFGLAWWGLSWVLVAWTPLEALPAWLGWGIASVLAAAILLGVPLGLLMWGWRNYRG